MFAVGRKIGPGLTLLTRNIGANKQYEFQQSMYLIIESILLLTMPDLDRFCKRVSIDLDLRVDFSPTIGIPVALHPIPYLHRSNHNLLIIK